MQTRSGYVYSDGAALLDLGEPWKVRYRSRYYITFPNAAVVEEKTGRIMLYYGWAYTRAPVAYVQIDELIACVRKYSCERAEPPG